ncbi:hypothetical protein IKE87_02175 [Candidatus Saccharibacteria bacterium]|nr:hypothetical protein [Candidatus Saccharibacteria bacterium]
MAKKVDFDKTIKKVEGISNKVDIIMRNRLIIAFFLIVDGITFLLNPDTTLAGMAQNIMLIIIFAAASVFIANLAAKKKDKKTIFISAGIIILAIIFYIYPDLVAAYLQLLLALFIIYEGASNIIRVLHLNNKLFKYTDAITKKYNKLIHRKKVSEEQKVQRKKFKEIDDSINTELEAQKKKLINPLENMMNKSAKSSALYIITNSVSVIFGIILLVCPGVSMMVWGAIFLYTGISNMIIGVKTMGLVEKIKAKKYKEIIFDAEKGAKGEVEKRAEIEAKKDIEKKSEIGAKKVTKNKSEMDVKSNK